MAHLAASISKEGAASASPAHSNLFVGNLASTVTEDELKVAFAPHGTIDSVLLTAKAGRPSGFVKMVEVEGAARAVTAVNGNQGWVVKFANYDVGQAPKWNQKGGPAFFAGGYGMGKGMGKGMGYGMGWPQAPWGGKGFGGGKYGGGWTFVKGGYSGGKGGMPELREDGPEKPEPPPSDNLYVKHLPLGVTEENLRDTFSPCGDIQELRVLRPDFALECAALVRFATQEEADKARTTLDATVVQGTTPPIYANAQTKKGESKQDHIYVRNVPTNTSEEKIKDLLGKYGEVKWCKVMRTLAGQTRIAPTCATLFEMGSQEEAEAAIAALNNSQLNFSDVAPEMKVRYAANKAAKQAPAAEEGTAPEPDTDMPATRLAAAPPP